MRDCFYLSTFICPSLFFFVFFNFSNKTVTWRVPENQLCTILEYDKKKKTIIQSIVLISGVPKGSVNNGLQCRIIADNFSFFFLLGTKSIFDCMNNSMLTKRFTPSCTKYRKQKGPNFQKQPLAFPTLFICKYLQTYNVYSEIWGGVKKEKHL